MTATTDSKTTRPRRNKQNERLKTAEAVVEAARALRKAMSWELAVKGFSNHREQIEEAEKRTADADHHLARTIDSYDTVCSRSETPQKNASANHRQISPSVSAHITTS